VILKYFGHVSRRKDDNLEKLMVQGKVEETWLDQVKQFTGKSFQDSIRSTSVREEWRETAKNTT